MNDDAPFEFGKSGHRARFMIVTQPRSGSYHLASLLGSAPDVTCLGELFKPNAVELPPWLRRQVGFARSDTALRDADPHGYLALLMAHCEKPVFGFKEFLDRIYARGIGKQTLRSRHWQKIFLFRNPIRKYLSLQRALDTGSYTKFQPDAAPGDNAVVRFDPKLFDLTVKLDRQLRDHFADLKAKRPRRNMALDYRDLNDPAKLADVLEFIRVEADPASLTSSYYRQNPLSLRDSFVDYDIMAAHALASGFAAELEDAEHPEA
ncbi:hypothetical protein [Paracoccus albus]|uniref:hypothetical protein n=1 Tax=Paracoccus albus TaxID=3017784 RepID=UPI0022F13D52|nr:hypothetical protein [Paracoccus albus]WBU61044.1 hypothetical protein PAF20_03775 [Paracoccus albus]